MFLAVAAGAPALKDRPAPPPVVGVWEAVAFTTKGPRNTATGEYADPRPRWTFTADGRWTDHTGRGGRYSVDVRASPPAITLTRDADGAAGRPTGDQTGTFRVDGDELTLTLTVGPDGAVCTATFRRPKNE